MRFPVSTRRRKKRKKEEAKQLEIEQLKVNKEREKSEDAERRKRIIFYNATLPTHSTTSLVWFRNIRSNLSYFVSPLTTHTCIKMPFCVTLIDSNYYNLWMVQSEQWSDFQRIFSTNSVCNLSGASRIKILSYQRRINVKRTQIKISSRRSFLRSYFEEFIRHSYKTFFYYKENKTNKTHEKILTK